MTDETNPLNWGGNYDEMHSVNEAYLNKSVEELAAVRAERMKTLAGMKLSPVDGNIPRVAQAESPHKEQNERPDFIGADGRTVFVQFEERNAFTKTSMAQPGAGLVK